MESTQILSFNKLQGSNRDLSLFFLKKIAKSFSQNCIKFSTINLLFSQKWTIFSIINVFINIYLKIKKGQGEVHLPDVGGSEWRTLSQHDSYLNNIINLFLTNFFYLVLTNFFYLVLL